MDVNVSNSQILPESFKGNKIIFQGNKKLGIMLSFVCLILLGIMPIISNGRPPAFNALDYTFFLSMWQFLFAIPLFIMSIKPKNGLFDESIDWIDKNRTLKVISVLALLFSIATFLYVLTFEKAGTINAAIAIQTFPLFTILLETVFFAKKKSLIEISFTGLLLLALMYLGTKGTFLLEELSFWFILALGVPILWSIAHLTLKVFMEKSIISPAQIIIIRVGIATLLSLFPLLILEGPNIILSELLDPNFQIFAIAMGFVYYTELMNWFYAIKNIDVSLAGSITTPTPVMTLIFALIFLKEILYFYQFIALVIVCISLYGLLYFGSKKN